MLPPSMLVHFPAAFGRPSPFYGGGGVRCPAFVCVFALCSRKSNLRRADIGPQAPHRLEGVALREGRQGPQVARSEPFRLGRWSSAAIQALLRDVVPDGQLGRQELRGAELAVRSVVGSSPSRSHPPPGLADNPGRKFIAPERGVSRRDVGGRSRPSLTFRPRLAGSVWTPSRNGANIEPNRRSQDFGRCRRCFGKSRSRAFAWRGVASAVPVHSNSKALSLSYLRPRIYPSREQCRDLVRGRALRSPLASLTEWRLFVLRLPPHDYER